MGEILQDSERYILQWWDVFYNTWNESHFESYSEAVQTMEQYKKDDQAWRVKAKYRIVRETTKQEVVYND